MLSQSELSAALVHDVFTRLADVDDSSTTTRDMNIAQRYFSLYELSEHVIVII